MAQINVLCHTSLDDYDLDRERWHQPGEVVERTDATLAVEGAQVAHDEPRIHVRATQIGRRKIVVIIRRADAVEPAAEVA